VSRHSKPVLQLDSTPTNVVIDACTNLKNVVKSAPVLTDSVIHP